MAKNIFLSIVVPAYKEEKRISIIAESIIKYQKSHDFETEVIFDVDGADDNTDAAAREYEGKIKNLRIISRKKNRGKGYTVKEGVQHSVGKYVLFSDADNSTPLEQVDKLLEYIEKYEVVIGSRYIRGGKLAHPQPFYRIAGSRALNLLIQLLATRGIKDTQCGFKLFQAKAATEIFRRATFDRFSFDIEILAIARKLGYKTKEIGVTWYDNPHSTVHPLRDGLRMVADSWRVRRNIILGKYR